MAPRVRNLLSLLARLALAPIFLYAGVQKLGDPEAFATVIGRYHILPSSLLHIAALFIPWLEIVLGVSLALGIFTRSSGVLSSLLCGSFAAAVSSAVLRGIDIDCGCFSGASKVSWYHVAVNVLMLLLGIILSVVGSERWSLDSRYGAAGGDELEFPPKRIFCALAVLGLGISLVLIGRAEVASLTSENLVQASSSAGATATSATGSSQLLEFSADVLDLGQVKQGRNLKGQIEYRNVSGRTLHIDHTEATCGCTEGQYSKATIEPGESGVLTVGFHSGVRDGPAKETVRLYIDGAEAPVSIDLVAVVLPIFTLEPNVILLPAGAKTRVRMASNEPGLPFRIVAFESPIQEVEFSVLGYPSPGVADFQVTAKSSIPSPIAPSEAWTIGVQTDVQDLPPVHFYVAPAGPR